MWRVGRYFWLALPILLGSCGALGEGEGPQDLIVTRGAVCGTPAIQGVTLGEVPGPGRCGFTDAVEVDAVGGVLLSQPSKMRCETARTLNAWVTDAVRPTIGKTGGGVKSLKVAAHYACRRRNHQAGARLSEHSFGKAIDITAFQLADGSELSVLDDWGKGEKGRTLRELHKTACGPFGTVLGPESDRFHQTHFHLDTADYRSGPYCR